MKIKCKHIIILLFLIIIFSIRTLIILKKSNDDNDNINNKTNINNNDNSDNTTIFQKPTEPYGFEYLEDWQKEAYNSIEQLQIGEYYFLKQDQKVEDVQIILDLYNQNNPQILPIIYTVIKNEGFPDYSHTIYKSKWLSSNMDEAIEKLNQINQKTDEIISSIPKSSNDYAKIKMIYDYFVTNITFDFIFNEDATINLDSYSAYGALIKQKAVCEGQARAFQYVANKAGVYTLYVTDSIHSWNIVWLEGKYYVVDTTAKQFLEANNKRIPYVGSILTPDTNHSYSKQ